MAYVPQKHERTFPYSVREIVTMGRAAYLGLFESPSAADRHRADEALEVIGIGHLRNRPYTQLSGGETQLVMIARALVQEAPLIVLDEPTAHLDFRYELVIMEIIGHLVRENGLAIIMATHFPNHAFYFQNTGITTTVALLHEGGFLAKGPPEEVLDEGMVEKLYGVEVQVIAVATDNDKRTRFIVPIRTLNQSSLPGPSRFNAP